MSKVNPHERCSFCPVSCNEILEQMKNLDTKNHYSKICTSLYFEQNSFFFFIFFFHKNVQQCIKISIFPSNLAGVTSSYKKKKKNLVRQPYTNKCIN